MFSLPQEAKLITALKPQVSGALTGDYVSLKNSHRAFVVVAIGQNNAAQVVASLEQATAVDGSGHIPLVNVCPLWVVEDTTLSDALVEQADAVAYTTTVGQTSKLIVFQVSPESFTLAGADCLTVRLAASDPANIVAAWYLLTPLRYNAATPPSAIVD